MDRMQFCISFDPLGVTSRSATLLPPCTFVMYLTLVTTALGVALATVIAQDPWLGTRIPAVLLEKCHRGKLKLQPVWLGYQQCFWYSWTHALCSSPFSPLSLPPGNLNSRDQMKISTQQFLFFSPPPMVLIIGACSGRNMCHLRDICGCERGRLVRSFFRLRKQQTCSVTFSHPPVTCARHRECCTYTWS